MKITFNVCNNMKQVYNLTINHKVSSFSISSLKCLWNIISFILYLIVDINECESSPCNNFGTCNDEVNGYNCSCVAGFTGEDCETGRPSLPTAFCHQLGITVIRRIESAKFVHLHSQTVKIKVISDVVLSWSSVLQISKLQKTCVIKFHSNCRHKRMWVFPLSQFWNL